MLAIFKEQFPDQRLSLAETFSGPIFQMTGLMGVVWLFYMLSTKKKNIEFINDSIQYQMPLLLAVSLVKYLVVLKNKFLVYKSMFYINLGCYILFAAAVVLIDYRAEITGRAPSH